MYANQFAAGRGFKPGSMTLALALTALPIVGLITSMGVSRLIREDRPFEVYVPRDDPPPPPPFVEPKKVDTKTPASETTVAPPVTTTVPSDNTTKTTTEVTPPGPIAPEVGTGTVIAPVITPKPVIVAPLYDQRYASALQPPYPAAEVRAGNTGRVVMRVLVGTDGRVKQVEKVSAASDAFFAAAEKQALTKWRFKPATSDGVAIEQWVQMSLRFELQDQ